MKNRLFRKSANADIVSMGQILQREGWTPMSDTYYTKPGAGVIQIDEAGWAHNNPEGKEVDFGSDWDDLSTYLVHKPNESQPQSLLKKHPDEGFMRGKKFRQPEIKWKENEQGEKVPEFNEKDEKFMKELGINGSLRKKVFAAYMNGYAEHAAKWLREHGQSSQGSDKYAESNGLKPDYFRDAIQTMSRYAAYTKRKKAGEKHQYTFAVPLESASHVARHLFKAGLPDFDVQTDEDMRITEFKFPTPADREVAHQIVYQAFKRQIEAGKGLWANWKELEASPSELRSDPPQRKHLMSSNDLDACIYCKGQEPKNKAQRKRLKDTPRNRAKELTLYRALTPKSSAGENRPRWNTPQEYAQIAAPGVLDSWRQDCIEEGLPTNDIDDLIDHVKSSYRADNPPEAYEALMTEVIRLFKSKKPRKASLLKKADDSPFHEIADPVCLCTHTFHDHERGCDHCDCRGFDPAPMTKQVEYVCERRAFGRVGKSTNPMRFERDKNERMLTVHFDGDRIGKVEFLGRKGDNPDTRQGWDGFFSFTQAFGD